EIALPTALQEPLAIRADQLLRPPPAPRQRCQPSPLPVVANPVDRRLDPDPKPGRRLPPRQALPLDRVHNTLAKVSRVRLAHPCWPPPQPASLNQKTARVGNPNDSQSDHPALATAAFADATLTTNDNSQSNGSSIGQQSSAAKGNGDWV